MLLFIAVFVAACNRGPDDATLTTNVKSKLSADTTVPASAINVSAKDGAVTLAGTVNTEAEKAKAEQVAKGVEGVKSVTNSLTVRPPVQASVPVGPDEQIKQTVMANLTKYGVTGVTAEVNNGEVTLKGEIQRAKLQDAMKAANEANPKKVNNQMTVK
jgi:osmotically-inducible protein OsmY